MKLQYHKEFIKYALSGLSFGDLEKLTIIVGNVAQDTFYFYDGERHFDRKVKVRRNKVDKSAHSRYFYKAKNYLLSERDKTISRIGHKHYYYARLSLGRALHTLQDFFAHSNFIDLSNAEKNIISTALRERTNREIPKTLKLTYFRLLAKTSTDEYPHGKYNKDDTNCSGFKYAEEAAKAHSKEFVTKVKDDVIRIHGLKKWKKFRD